MENYIKHISYLAKNNINQIFSNSGEEHALEVFSQIFQESKEVIRIFAGSLCSNVPQDPKYIQALSAYIERGGHLEIILNRFDAESILESNIMQRLAFFVSEGNSNIILYRTSVKVSSEKKEIHFTVADQNMYRIEVDIDKRVANCNFNDEEMSSNLISLFDKIKAQESTELVNLLELFQIG